MAVPLCFPAGEETGALGRLTVGSRCVVVPGWPWQATMLTAVNCFVLWGFTWLQFLTNLMCFTQRGHGLWFYVVRGEPLGLTIPEAFFGFSVALSVFALGAVIGSTWKVPRMWKRLLCVCLFAGMATGLASLSLHLRHFSYEQAVAYRDELSREYQGWLREGENDGFSEWLGQRLEEVDGQLREYRQSFGEGGR